MGLPCFLISLMATVSNTCLNRYVSAYSNEAMAGMGIAKKMGMLAFALAQGLNQGTLPLIGYTYTSGRRQRMLAAMKTLLLFCVSISFGETLLLFFGAESITGCFIQNQETVAYGRLFLRLYGHNAEFLCHYPFSGYRAEASSHFTVIDAQRHRGCTADVSAEPTLGRAGDRLGYPWGRGHRTACIRSVGGALYPAAVQAAGRRA